MVVTDFLVNTSSEVMEYDFTKEVEDELMTSPLAKVRRHAIRHFYDPPQAGRG